MDVKYTIRKLANRLGFDLVKTDNIVRYPPARRMKLMSSCGIDLIFDVGANIGQFAEEIRKLGYKGRIVSFEPLTSAFRVLEKKSAGDPAWEIVNIALGSEDSKNRINISENSYSSSILDMMPTHLKADPSSQYIDKEEVTVQRLDSVFDRYFHEGDRLYLKIDTQGYEKHVIDGAEHSLDKVMCIQMEVSLVPLYDGELLLVDMIGLMSKKGFFPWALEAEFADPETGQLLQVNTIFVRSGIGDGKKK